MGILENAEFESAPYRIFCTAYPVRAIMLHLTPNQSYALVKMTASLGLLLCYFLSFYMIVGYTATDELEEASIHTSQFHAKSSRVPTLEKIIINNKSNKSETSIWPRSLSEQFSILLTSQCHGPCTLSYAHQSVLPSRISSDDGLIIDERQLLEINDWKVIHLTEEQISANFSDHPRRLSKILENEMYAGLESDGLIVGVENFSSGSEWVKIATNNKRGENWHRSNNGTFSGSLRRIRGDISSFGLPLYGLQSAPNNNQSGTANQNLSPSSPIYAGIIGPLRLLFGSIFLLIGLWLADRRSGLWWGALSVSCLTLGLGFLLLPGNW